MDFYIQREQTASISHDFFKGKIIILVGPRQVGKTTLIQKLISNKKKVIQFLADNPTDRTALENIDFNQLDGIIKDNKIIVIDEAQKITGVGQTLKLLIDAYKTQKQILVTGSSSLNLLSNTQEPLTGRKFVYELFGLSLRELFPSLSPLEVEKELPLLLVYGSYPEIYLKNKSEKERILKEITTSYLYKDILQLEQIRNPAVLHKLLSALALQIGYEVSLSELAKLVHLDVKTVERYIDLLEKNYVIFRLPPYYSNQRKTLSKLNKIYFYDLGIRNTLINNFNPLEIRNDVGPLWENFLILERYKYRNCFHINANQYFWKTYDGAEIDLVEEQQSKLFGYEFKWGKKRTSPKSWLSYPNAQYVSITKKNFIEFLSK